MTQNALQYNKKDFKDYLLDLKSNFITNKTGCEKFKLLFKLHFSNKTLNE